MAVAILVVVVVALSRYLPLNHSNHRCLPRALHLISCPSFPASPCLSQQAGQTDMQVYERTSLSARQCMHVCASGGGPNVGRPDAAPRPSRAQSTGGLRLYSAERRSLQELHNRLLHSIILDPSLSRRILSSLITITMRTRSGDTKCILLARSRLNSLTLIHSLVGHEQQLQLPR